jgi:hypothetical protein
MLEADVTKVRNLIMSNSYPESVRTMAVDVMAGKQSMAVLDAVVAAADTILEMTKSNGAQALSKKTPTGGDGSSAVTGGDGVINYTGVTGEGEISGNIQTIADIKTAAAFLQNQV